MKLDFSAAQLFLSLLAGQAEIEAVFEHPAYRAVQLHARRFGSGLGPQDLVQALQGQPSPFYGMDGLSERLPSIRTFLEKLHQEGGSWLEVIQQTLSELFPQEDLDITIYPILGYDMGIGLEEVVCQNCNVASYLAEPSEFFFYTIHECAHVLYERSHAIPPLSAVVSPTAWRSYFNLWFQNEGFAVFAPLRLRQERGRLEERDYRVLYNPAELEKQRLAFWEVLAALDSGRPLTREEYLEACFGDRRLTYRLGCELLRRIEKSLGREAVRQAFYLEGDEFMERYQLLFSM